MIKVNYDQTTNLVLGYYPDSVKYNSIPTPNIEIEDNAQINNKKMCVKNGVYQEFIPTPEVQLQEAKDSKTAQVLANRNNWMYQPVFYVVDSVEREFKATEIAGLNLIAVARSPRNIIIGTVNWLDIFDAPILLTIDQAEGIIDIIEDQRSYSYFHQVTLDTEIKNCNSVAEVEAININF
jgi:hypothetical protein